MNLCQHEYPWWEPYRSVSTGPLFKLVDPRPAPSWLDVGEDAWHRIPSQFPIAKKKRRGKEWNPLPTPVDLQWHAGLIMVRHPRWPLVTLLPDSWVHLNTMYLR